MRLASNAVDGRNAAVECGNVVEVVEHDTVDVIRHHQPHMALHSDPGLYAEEQCRCRANGLSHRSSRTSEPSRCISVNLLHGSTTRVNAGERIPCTLEFDSRF